MYTSNTINPVKRNIDFELRDTFVETLPCADVFVIVRRRVSTTMAFPDKRTLDVIHLFLVVVFVLFFVQS